MAVAVPFPSRRARHPAGLAVVAGLHGVLVWMLVQSLGHRGVDLEPPPLAVDILEPPPPPPPPPPVLDVAPAALPPPPSFVPPPEIRVRPPPLPPPAITVQRSAPPPTPVVVAPAAPAPVPAPAAPPSAPADLSRPARLEVSQCTRPAYPRAALRSEATGTTRIRFRVDAGGRVIDARVLQRSGPSREHGLLDRAAVDTLGRCRFSAGLDARGRPVGGFATVEYVWTLQ
ncbi:energy transducer TonB [Rubrivivax gelatinosus]|uniref:Protein TonB n=1 Tax=Rubrivivax gelatinosus TaxID=28068 RepID=A0A4R2LYI9_RUBGE|nr:energy transducer TonB [Rubrivivax gelatinosus]MBK1689391.1 hypothetical protein [Rubrivivax gelatinosus]TCO99738.1 protein TonB [Rubrivivax gelatinosus]